MTEKRRQQLLAQLHQAGITDQRVLDAMAHVDRGLFVEAQLLPHAYRDMALPIGCGQTISQPFMVALMTQALHLTGNERVLEIGTGSGYQAAILAQLCSYVYSVERHQQLAQQASWRLMEAGIRNVSVIVGDGSLGWPEAAPYEGILVTAAAPEVPISLVEQLSPGGRLVLPVGLPEEQDLLLIERRGAKVERTSLGACVFVPLIGREGWSEDR
ncbi:protein-L-isoaspartate(D-aspartate) O-methyltransferase [Thermosporothrix hazakensis]|jgi:protein-L-isoaspartate(D-aspartate) O-methyltransferase|uniref:Protein-L-isoaspartate O-methyltransferase n=2 Tax=Thermosporothrix TaxID=768650 RepID=A0A326UEF9_THEHA|nr:protein-L-isoaspartate(D-aspartate) O-methyltransferase [Thermosporothrix hazakensis]PZW36231.1 protein-L-isoaspartate(D-aspartate) O-methyltransferase [Thermosporothrix hazakensis]BBH88694.1 protein-L-isoaspartate O-methyltransferase [Thermosporothrix sp. COM3]GCE46880.1 protein-L-isoaspartate O-methyltransferase [Thermosporothrix hazakensis]